MIIVTGGAGFIGSQLIRHLNRQNEHDILIVDHMGTSTKHQNLLGLSFSDYVERDYFIDNLKSLTKNAKTIFHMGACSNTTETNGSYMIDVNYRYTKQLIDWSLDQSIDIIYASSAAVYGNGKAGFSETKSIESPLNIYGISKWLTDNYVRKLMNQTPASQVLGLRFFNVFGPGESHKQGMASVAYHLFNQATASQRVALFAGSDQFKRDFIYIDDVIAIMTYFYQNKESGIINCGTGHAQSFYDLAVALLSTLNLSPDVIKYTPFPKHLAGKYQAYTQADTTLLNLYGFKNPFIPLSDALNSYKEHLCL